MIYRFKIQYQRGSGNPSNTNTLEIPGAPVPSPEPAPEPVPAPEPAPAPEEVPEPEEVPAPEQVPELTP
jgi:hypothetical protein